MIITEPIKDVLVDTTDPGTFIHFADGQWLKRMADGTLHAGKDLILLPIENKPNDLRAIGFGLAAGAIVLAAGAALYAGYKILGSDSNEKITMNESKTNNNLGAEPLL